MLLHSSTPSSERTRASRLVSCLLAALAFTSAAMFVSACGGDDGSGGSGGSGASGGGGAGGGNGGSGGAGECIGGVIVNGVCEGKCTPDKCLADNTCVGNRCVLKCDSHEDCYPDGSQSCAPTVEDDTNAPINACLFHGKSAGIGTTCPFGAECANWLSCPDGGTCFPFQCGGDPAACVLDDAACNGAEGCVIGKCAADGAPCRVGCQTECKPWLECATAGEGDAEAYCTNRDCESDTDCIGGYFCGIVRDPHSICGSNPKKGDNNFCGQTTEDCVTVGPDGQATLGPDGQPDNTSRFEGSLCLLRKSCIKRGQAAPCTSDIDCSLFDGQKCVAFAGESRCARTCAATLDCAPDTKCDPGLGACVPKADTWTIPPGTFCTQCLNDEDCGSNGTAWACTDLSSGMKACFDQSFPDTCNTDADCPKAPGGKAGTCLDEAEGVGPGDSLYNRCYLPLNASTGKTSCW